jgi:CDP-diacylglycerol--glycerol-3-phosphate 3-phosphatidyltransferase
MRGSIINAVPLSLTALRALLAPMIVTLALLDPDPRAFGTCLALGFLSDVFDGIVARRLGIATPSLRRLDSGADTLFYVAATFAAWHLYPQVIVEHHCAALVLGALEIGRYAFDLVKFGRETSYHMWSSKVWGIVLFASFFALLAFGYTGAWVALPLYVGILADVEGLSISFMLAEWESDVPSFLHAFKSRVAARRDAI